VIRSRIEDLVDEIRWRSEAKEEATKLRATCGARNRERQRRSETTFAFDGTNECAHCVCGSNRLARLRFISNDAPDALEHIAFASERAKILGGFDQLGRRVWSWAHFVKDVDGIVPTRDAFFIIGSGLIDAPINAFDCRSQPRDISAKTFIDRVTELITKPSEFGGELGVLRSFECDVHPRAGEYVFLARFEPACIVVRMGIKPALGWLALLLFTTTAQAEGARDLLTKGASLNGKGGKGAAPAAIASVIPKTKAPPPALANASSSSNNTNSGSAGLTIVENGGKPRTDYEAEIYSGVPLDGSIAKERGFDKGLVTMVFERQKKGAFRVGKDHIRRVVRLAPEERSIITTTIGSAKARPKDHVDVLEMEEGMGVIVVDTTVHSSGMFTTSDVYVFTKPATLDQRIGAIESLPAAPTATKTRLREALVAAEWAPIKKTE
jgi:hypothetical protein